MKVFERGSLLFVGIATALIAATLYGLLALPDWSWRQEAAVAKPSPRRNVPEPPNIEVFSPIQVVSRMPAITNANVIAASDVEDEVNANELVLGVTVGGEARAYPINTMTGPDREIFNDQLAGTAIAATW